MDRIVLAYSGGPASSVAIPWLRERHAAEVVTVTVDLGQHESLDGIRVRALGSGAVRAHVLDRRDVFARHHLLPAVQDGAVDIDSPDVLASLALPLVAHALVEIAEIEGTKTVAHACVSEPDRATIDKALAAIAPGLRVIDVAHDWTLAASDMEAYARERGIPFTRPASAVDAEAALQRVASLAAPMRIAIEFRTGVPVKINGVEMDLVELLTSLDTIAAAHGVAGSVVLGVAYRALQQRVGGAAVTGAQTVGLQKGVCEVVTDVR